MKCMTLLQDDHRLILQSLEILDEMVQRLARSDRVDMSDMHSILHFLKEFGDGYHQAMEELILFPALMQSGGEHLDAIVKQHSVERAALAEIEETLNPQQGAAFQVNSRRLIDTLRNHIANEESGLVQLAERQLSPPEDERIAQLFAKSRIDPDAILNLPHLQRKYNKDRTENRATGG